MDNPQAFQHLLQRVRAKDQAACTELVKQFQEEIYRAVRPALIGMGLQRVLDPMDICQAVMASFFDRVVTGPYKLDTPQALRQLLLTMARNKVMDEARKYSAFRRDHRRQMTDGEEDCLQGLPADISTPSSIAVKRELIEAIHRHLSDEERYLVEQRTLGRDWASLGAERNLSPEAMRKKVDRAILRVTKQLGLA
jgi:RNA polymerase sigma factor (sigma-70 family)